MNTTEYELLYIPAMKVVFQWKTDVGFDPSIEDTVNKDLERIFPDLIFTVWVNRLSSEDTPLLPEEKSLLEVLGGPHGRAIYLAACHQREIDP